MHNFTHDLSHYRGSYALFIRQDQKPLLAANTNQDLHQKVAFHIEKYGFSLAQKNQIPKYKVIIGFEENHQKFYGKQTTLFSYLRKTGKIQGIIGSGEAFEGTVRWQAGAKKGSFAGHTKNGIGVNGIISYESDQPSNFFAMTTTGDSWRGQVLSPSVDQNQQKMVLTLQGKAEFLGRFSARVTTYYDAYAEQAYQAQLSAANVATQKLTMEIYPFHSPVGKKSERLFIGEVVHRGHQDVSNDRMVLMMVRALLHKFPGYTQRTEYLTVTSHWGKAIEKRDSARD